MKYNYLKHLSNTEMMIKLTLHPIVFSEYRSLIIWIEMTFTDHITVFDLSTIRNIEFTIIITKMCNYNYFKLYFPGIS